MASRPDRLYATELRPYATQTYCDECIPIRCAAPRARSSRAPMRKAMPYGPLSLILTVTELAIFGICHGQNGSERPGPCRSCVAACIEPLAAGRPCARGIVAGKNFLSGTAARSLYIFVHRRPSCCTGRGDRQQANQNSDAGRFHCHHEFPAINHVFAHDLTESKRRRITPGCWDALKHGSRWQKEGKAGSRATLLRK